MNDLSEYGYVPVENPLPEGYRWATADEAELWTAKGPGTFKGEKWVKVGTDRLDNDHWDLALPDEGYVEDMRLIRKFNDDE